MTRLSVKTFYKFLFIILLAGAAIQANAQPVSLVRWDFETPFNSSMNPTTAPTSVSAGMTASNFTAVGVTGAVGTPGYDGSANCGTYPGSPYPAPCYSFTSVGWSTANAIDLGKYLEFSVATQPGCTFRLTGIQYGVRFNGSTTIETRTSYDNFAAPWGTLVTDATQGNWNGYTRASSSGPPAGISGLTNLTFRVYLYNSTPANPAVPWDLGTYQGEFLTDYIRIVGAITCPAAQPVDLTTFEGKAAGNQVQLSWATNWERNADRFEIERSQDAVEFGVIGQVRAAGDASQKQDYGYTDERALAGINYYRLRQVDKDGSIRYSNVISVTTRPEAPAILVMGNPIEGGRIDLKLFNLDASKLQLTDMQGHPLTYRLTETGRGLVTLEPTSPLSSGIYLVKARQVPAVKIIVR